LDWGRKTVLVTGAGGFIGSHLTERLIELGARTRAFVEYNSTGSWGWLDCSPLNQQIEVVLGDIRDRDSIQKATEGVDIIFHLAALIAIPYSYQAPLSYVQTNIEGTLNVLQSALRSGVGLVVHTSTSEVYGTARITPISESHPLQGQSPYSASKIGADKLAESFHLSFELPIVTVRPFNTFGPRQSARAVIPTIISQCLTTDVVQLGSLHPTRDLNYVANIVEGFLKAALVPEAIGQTINLGSGREISIGDLAQLIVRLCGRENTIKSDEQRTRPDKSEVGRLLADNTLARALLGWEPDVALEDGLLRTIEWRRQHLNRYRSDVYNI
jgi:dTDP-glucose 4,6-dehydratase